MISAPEAVATLPRALSSYPDQSGLSIVELLIGRVRIEPFNAIATLIFALAIAHTFAAVRFSRHAARVQQAHDQRLRAAGQPPTPSVAAELLHFLGEIRSEEHTSELQSQSNLVCRLLLEKKKKKK